MLMVAKREVALLEAVWTQRREASCDKKQEGSGFRRCVVRVVLLAWR
jgi:hypothetical protein